MGTRIGPFFSLCTCYSVGLGEDACLCVHGTMRQHLSSLPSFSVEDTHKDTTHSTHLHGGQADGALAVPDEGQSGAEVAGGGVAGAHGAVLVLH